MRNPLTSSNPEWLVRAVGVGRHSEDVGVIEGTGGPDGEPNDAIRIFLDKREFLAQTKQSQKISHRKIKNFARTYSVSQLLVLPPPVSLRIA